MVNPTWDELYPFLKEAGLALYQKDSFLIAASASERSLVFRYGLYLNAFIKDAEWMSKCVIDCEYNRHGCDPKQLRIQTEQEDSKEDSKILPDLIIHRRGTHSNNLLVIEFKTWHNKNQEHDRLKLSGMLEDPYNYEYAVTGLFNKDELILMRL